MPIDNQDIKQLINILQKMLNDNDDQSDVDEPVQQQTNSAIKTKNRNMRTSNAHHNKFTDMPEKNMHKEDIEIDKKLNTNKPTPRNRSFNFIDVRCRVCGKTESVNPVLVDSINRYKCNNCSTSSG